MQLYITVHVSFKTSEYTNVRKVKVFVTDGWIGKRKGGGGRGRGDRLDLSFVLWGFFGGMGFFKLGYAKFHTLGVLVKSGLFAALS